MTEQKYCTTCSHHKGVLNKDLYMYKYEWCTEHDELPENCIACKDYKERKHYHFFAQNRSDKNGY